MTQPLVLTPLPLDRPEMDEEDPLRLTSSEADEMAALIRRIGRSSVLTQAVLAELGNSRLSASTVRALVTLLKGPFAERWRDRIAAVWALGCTGPDSDRRGIVVDALQGALECGQVRPGLYVTDRTQSTMARTRPLSVIIGVGLGLWALKGMLSTAPGDLIDLFHRIVIALLASGPVGVLAYGLASWLLFPLVLPVSCAVDSARNVRIRVAAAIALGRLGAVESAAALARAALDINPAVSRAAEAALRSMLPYLTEEQYGLLDTQVCPALCRLLNVRSQQLFAGHFRTEDLAVDLLAALGRVGDGRALPLVETLAVDGWTERTRQAARSILPVLRERQRRERDHGSLLRGAAAPDNCAALLRPVDLDAALAPESLLRPLLRGQR